MFYLKYNANLLEVKLIDVSGTSVMKNLFQSSSMISFQLAIIYRYWCVKICFNSSILKHLEEVTVLLVETV